MEFWDTIVHTATLGTDKRQLKKEDFSDNLAEVFALINEDVDKEEQYLNIAAVAFNYRKCGVVPLNKDLNFTSAEEEVAIYCSAIAHRLLTDIVSVENYRLLELWLQECNRKNLIVLPEFILLLPILPKSSQILLSYYSACNSAAVPTLMLP